MEEWGGGQTLTHPSTSAVFETSPSFTSSPCRPPQPHHAFISLSLPLHPVTLLWRQTGY